MVAPVAAVRRKAMYVFLSDEVAMERTMIRETDKPIQALLKGKAGRRQV